MIIDPAIETPASPPRRAASRRSRTTITAILACATLTSVMTLTAFGGSPMYVFTPECHDTAGDQHWVGGEVGTMQEVNASLRALNTGDFCLAGTLTYTIVKVEDATDPSAAAESKASAHAKGESRRPARLGPPD